MRIPPNCVATPQRGESYGYGAFETATCAVDQHWCTRYHETALARNRTVSGYYRELERLPSAIEFARNVEVAPLSDLIDSSLGKPLMAVGSGGSFTAATLAAILHETATHQIAKANTPYQALAIPSLIDANIILFSARGSNSDALIALKGLARRTMGNLFVLTAAPQSRLAHVANSRTGAHLFSFELPFAPDGFLATNSLIATSVLISRAYRYSSSLDDVHSEQLGMAPTWYSKPETTQSLRELLTRQTLIVLAGSWAWPAAVDLESKFSEAGLAHVQLVDYRNFAHGRHFWLAKRGESTGVIALTGPETQTMAARTLSALPEQINCFTLSTALSNSSGAIDLMCQGMFLVGLAAEQLGTRLTRPGVPAFGRRLYNSGYQYFEPEAAVEAWVAKKTMAMGLTSTDIVKTIRQSLFAFLTELANARFEALVTDYDGTLFERSHQEPLPPAAIQRELIRLLSEGLILGVATGRGNSVTRALRTFVPECFWDQVVIGLYGGAVITTLNEAQKVSLNQDEDLVKAKACLQKTLPSLNLHFDLNPQLLSIRPREPVDLSTLRSLVSGALDSTLDERRVVESAHSIDVLGQSASKLHVVDAVLARTRSNDPACVLRVGDQGAWNGNDYHLLASGTSLSVGRVSGDLRTCWNLSTPSFRSTLATAEYLRALRKHRHAFQFVLKWPPGAPSHALEVRA